MITFVLFFFAPHIEWIGKHQHTKVMKKISVKELRSVIRKERVGNRKWTWWDRIYHRLSWVMQVYSLALRSSWTYYHFPGVVFHFFFLAALVSVFHVTLTAIHHNTIRIYFCLSCWKRPSALYCTCLWNISNMYINCNSYFGLFFPFRLLIIFLFKGRCFFWNYWIPSQLYLLMSPYWRP